jgi:hypothetical protein
MSPLCDGRDVVHEDVVADGLEVEEDAVEEAEHQQSALAARQAHQLLPVEQEVEAGDLSRIFINLIRPFFAKK